MLNEREFASSVLKKEAQALLFLADNLSTDFCNALDCLYTANGRIVVTGMGKSGHIGRKIAATLASTGSPAFFLHPAEAAHGDLGMLTSNDVILAFSNSGNTYELSNVIFYAVRYGLPIVGVTCNADSFLGTHATHLLLLPKISEACPLDCAPTTSTTMQIALGDALALTLMQRHGCSQEDFHRWHPGGSLGSKLLLVNEIMHKEKEIPLVDISASMSEALIEMTGKGFGVVGIVEKGLLVGIITDGDLRRHMDSLLVEKKVCEVMHSSPITIEGNMLVAAALHIMEQNKITSLFVLNEGRIQGIVHIHDCLRNSVK